MKNSWSGATRTPGPSGIYRSQVVLGFLLKVNWLWQELLPSPVRAAAEIASVHATLIEAFEQALAEGKSHESWVTILHLQEHACKLDELLHREDKD